MGFSLKSPTLDTQFRARTVRPAEQDPRYPSPSDETQKWDDRTTPLHDESVGLDDERRRRPTLDTHWIPRTFPAATLHHSRGGSARKSRETPLRRRHARAVTLRVSSRWQGRADIDFALQQVSRHQLSYFALFRTARRQPRRRRRREGKSKREREGFSAHTGRTKRGWKHTLRSADRAHARASRYLGHAASRGRDARLTRLRAEGWCAMTLQWRFRCIYFRVLDADLVTSIGASHFPYELFINHITITDQSINF